MRVCIFLSCFFVVFRPLFFVFCGENFSGFKRGGLERDTSLVETILGSTFERSELSFWSPRFPQEATDVLQESDSLIEEFRTNDYKVGPYSSY